MAVDFPPMIGKYKVVGEIARGGMGVVYKAFHPLLKRYVVIKKMTVRGNNANTERFNKEAQLLMDMNTPYIVHLYDYFTEAGYRYMVEELVDGIALDKLLKKQTVLPPPIAMIVLQDACSALKYAHSKNIIHRDIKPGNILISKKAGIKLADFGIATDEAEQGDGITVSGVSLGTPAYMSPEQFKDSSKVDKRADIYSLGIMLYEMVTGTKPYPGEFNMETFKIIKKGRYIHPRKIDKKIPMEIQSLIHKMIRPSPKRRFQSIEGVLRAIKKYLRHYDIHDLKVQLARSVLTEGYYQFPFFNPKDKLRRRIKRVITGLLIFALAGFLFWRSGLLYKTLLRKLYTPVNIELEVPRSLSANLDLPIKAFFFENDAEQIPELKWAERDFALKGSRFFERLFTVQTRVEVVRLASKNKTYDVKTLYLKKGDYRMKVVAGPYVWWKSFHVDSKPVLIECDFLKNSTRRLEVSSFVYDKLSGSDISSKAKIELLYKNNWKELSEIPEEELQSGTVWKIKVSCPGYIEERFSLLIDWYQDKLFLSAELMPNK